MLTASDLCVTTRSQGAVVNPFGLIEFDVFLDATRPQLAASPGVPFRALMHSEPRSAGHAVSERSFDPGNASQAEYAGSIPVIGSVSSALSIAERPHLGQHALQA